VERGNTSHFIFDGVLEAVPISLDIREMYEPIITIDFYLRNSNFYLQKSYCIVKIKTDTIVDFEKTKHSNERKSVLDHLRKTQKIYFMHFIFNK
jgi:ArsR family metal-binding transcriptional regulator